MIQSIQIKNYQSHKNSVLEFESGINAVVGSSNNGKTAVLRAFNWLINNRPTGFSNVSYWDRDKNKKPKSEQSVTILRDNGDGVSRIRTKDYNGYELLSQEEVTKLEAVGTDVPETVSNFFNLNETNIQKQMDQPFMISESASEVARFFNKIIQLDIIDRVLSNAETKRRQNNQNIEKIKTDIKNNEEQLEELEWVDSAKILIENAWIIKSEIDIDNKSIENINNLLLDAEKYQSEIYNSKSYDDVNSLIVEIENQYRVLEDTKIDRERLYELVSKCDQLEKELSKQVDYTAVIAMMDDIQDLHTCIQDKIKEKITLDNILNEYDVCLKNIADYENEIKDLQSQMPDVCPLCGGELHAEI